MTRTALVFGAIAAAFIGLWLWLRNKGRAASGTVRPAPANPRTLSPGAAAQQAGAEGIDTIVGTLTNGIATTLGGIFSKGPQSTTWGYSGDNSAGFDSAGGGTYAPGLLYTDSESI